TTSAPGAVRPRKSPAARPEKRSRALEARDPQRERVPASTKHSPSSASSFRFPSPFRFTPISLAVPLRPGLLRRPLPIVPASAHLYTKFTRARRRDCQYHVQIGGHALRPPPARS